MHRWNRSSVFETSVQEFFTLLAFYGPMIPAGPGSTATAVVVATAPAKK